MFVLFAVISYPLLDHTAETVICLLLVSLNCYCVLACLCIQSTILLWQICPSVCLSHAGSVLKRMHIAQGPNLFRRPLLQSVHWQLKGRGRCEWCWWALHPGNPRTIRILGFLIHFRNPECRLVATYYTCLAVVAQEYVLCSILHDIVL